MMPSQYSYPLDVYQIGPTGWKLQNTHEGLAGMDVAAGMGAKEELEEIIQWKSGPPAMHCYH